MSTKSSSNGSKTETLPSTLPSKVPRPKSKSEYSNIDWKDLGRQVTSKVKAVHVVGVVGVLAVFLGYVSVAPMTDLPSWPLYTLNAKTWQFFEHWGQHVKPHHIRLMTTTLQHIESRALYIITYLEVPDMLEAADAPLSCEEIKNIADESTPEPINLPYLCRILHAASHFDLLHETSDHKYGLTPLSRYLTSSHPKSLKGFVKLYSGDESLIISTALSRSIFSGESGFKVTYRKELQEHKKEDPHFEVVHDAGTADGSRLHAPAIIADYPSFAQCRHICDIGGGLGSFLYSILKYYSFGIKATNFDLPDVIKNSELYFKNLQIEDKVSLVAGNFTEKIPELGCDCFIMKDILEEWSDEDALVILDHLRGTLKEGSRLIVIERVMHTGSYSEERFKSLMDLTMMAFNPSHSRLRTANELYFLLESSGFTDFRLQSTRASYNIIEAYPSKQ